MKSSHKEGRKWMASDMTLIPPVDGEVEIVEAGK